MRSRSTLRFVATVYAVGFVWLLVLMASSFVLVDPMLSLSATLEFQSSTFATFATLGLALLLASIVAVGLAVVLRPARSERREHTSHV